MVKPTMPLYAINTVQIVNLLPTISKSGSLILSVKEAKFLALFLEKEDISYSVEEIAGQVFQGEVSAEEISLYMAYLNNKLVQIHGNLQLMMEDGKISAEKKEG